jgi:hypothetical protein
MMLCFFRMIAAMSALACLVAACAPARFYSGPARPAGEIAVVETENSAIAAVDTNTFWPLPARLELLPGRHLVIVFYSEVPGGTLGIIDSLGRTTGSFRGPLQGCSWFDGAFEAGRTYVVRRDEGERLEMIDKASGKKIADAAIQSQPALTRCPAA